MITHLTIRNTAVELPSPLKYAFPKLENQTRSLSITSKQVQ